MVKGTRQEVAMLFSFFLISRRRFMVFNGWFLRFDLTFCFLFDSFFCLPFQRLKGKVAERGPVFTNTNMRYRVSRGDTRVHRRSVSEAIEKNARYTQKTYDNLISTSTLAKSDVVLC
jgi:hypothetical protein